MSSIISPSDLFIIPDTTLSVELVLQDIYFQLGKKYFNFCSILKTGNVYKLIKFLSTRKGYIYNFMKYINTADKFYIKRLKHFIFKALMTSQSEYNIIYIIELFTPTDVKHNFQHLFSAYIYNCLYVQQYNNVKILLDNYNIPNLYFLFNSISLYRLSRNNLDFNNMLFKSKDIQLDIVKIFYYLCRNSINKDNVYLSIDSPYFRIINPDIIEWYHTIKPFDLIKLRTLPTTKKDNSFDTTIKSLIVIEQNKLFLLLVKIPNLNTSVLFEPHVLKLICEF
jgi:hypothetical protein